MLKHRQARIVFFVEVPFRVRIRYSRKGRAVDLTLILFQFLSVGEGLSYGLAETGVVVVDGVEDNQPHLLHVRFAVVCEVSFIGEDVYDLRDDVISGVRFMYFFFNPAFKLIGKSVKTGASMFSDRTAVHPVFSIFCGLFFALTMPT